MKTINIQKILDTIILLYEYQMKSFRVEFERLFTEKMCIEISPERPISIAGLKPYVSHYLCRTCRLLGRKCLISHLKITIEFLNDR